MLWTAAHRRQRKRRNDLRWLHHLLLCHGGSNSTSLSCTGDTACSPADIFTVNQGSGAFSETAASGNFVNFALRVSGSAFPIPLPQIAKRNPAGARSSQVDVLLGCMIMRLTTSLNLILSLLESASSGMPLRPSIPQGSVCPMASGAQVWNIAVLVRFY